MIWSPFRRFRFLLLIAAVHFLGLGVFSPALGQELPWLGKGKVRLDFAPDFWAWDSRFGSATGTSGSLLEEVEPLGMDLTADPLGSEVIPSLSVLEASLQEALQDGGYRVRLGASQAIVEQSRLIFPFRLEVGVTDWLTVGAMVPLIRPRTEMDFVLNADSLNADVGLSPQLTGASNVARFVNDFGEILDSALEATPSDPTLLDARAYLDALAQAYAHASLFPVTGSAAGNQLQGRLDDFRVQLEALGLSGIPQEVPLAEEFLNEDGFDAFLATRRGMDAAPLENWTTPWVMGDVEVTASARVLQSGFQADSIGERPTLRYQVGVGALVRLGTGGQADPNRLLDLDPADGQMDLEGSVFGMVEMGDRFGGWGHLRYGIQLEGEVLRRIAAPGQALPNWGRLAPLNWTPGNYLELELNPRIHLTPDMTFGVRYHLWHKGEDSYALQPIDPELLAQLNYPDPALLNQETEQTLHEVGISTTYSTLAANDRGETPFPLLVRATYFHPIMGSGGQTPKGGRFQVGLTLYRTLWGGNSGS